MVGLADERKINQLRIWNLVVGLILAVQAVVIALLTNDFSLPVTATFMEGPPGTAPGLHHLFNISTGWGVFAFMAISAIALLLIASSAVFPWYKRNLLESRNYGRWIEYFFSSSLMIVLIAQICGISDVAALLAIFGVNASMIRSARWQEKYEKPGNKRLLRSGSGVSPALFPGWLSLYMCGRRNQRIASRLRVRIIISLFVFFNCFAVT
jgi:hypothetical protein